MADPTANAVKLLIHLWALGAWLVAGWAPGSCPCDHSPGRSEVLRERPPAECRCRPQENRQNGCCEKHSPCAACPCPCCKFQNASPTGMFPARELATHEPEPGSRWSAGVDLPQEEFSYPVAAASAGQLLPTPALLCRWQC